MVVKKFNLKKTYKTLNSCFTRLKINYYLKDIYGISDKSSVINTTAKISGYINLIQNSKIYYINNSKELQKELTSSGELQLYTNINKLHIGEFIYDADDDLNEDYFKTRIDNINKYIELYKSKSYDYLLTQKDMNDIFKSLTKDISFKDIIITLPYTLFIKKELSDDNINTLYIGNTDNVTGLTNIYLLSKIFKDNTECYILYELKILKTE